ncbi:beta-galactosidase [Microbispora bryophytorum]|uniref:beta-galactosidase n=1 Tax=Microbispora bryophytorum TaxID=1460882 RepID=UPI0033EB34BD
MDRVGGLAYGGDYNPEQWDPGVWREDVRLMREAGVNLVSLGVFAWASLEPEPGTYAFGWLDEVMDLLHENGVAVNLATPTAAPPAWLTHRHPEVLPVMADGERFGFGNRLHYDPSSPIYREHAANITRRLAERYSFHPALAMWHISNEYGPTAYNAAASAGFRRWLKSQIRRPGDPQRGVDHPLLGAGLHGLGPGRGAGRAPHLDEPRPHPGLQALHL